MKLIIQIPCFNEEGTLALTLGELPKSIPGITKIETLIINDGSRDATVDVARRWGVDHVLSFDTNKGLARAFALGVDHCLRLGADIIVNTDADNQYRAEYIKDLVRPILERRADIVIGNRPIESNEEFSPAKKFFQRFGSRVVSFLGRCNVPDAASGFRAYSRYAALNLIVSSTFTYTHETIIQAGLKNMRIESVDIETNPSTRSSRLFKTMFGYIFRSMVTIILVFVRFRPLPAFFVPGGASIFAGFILCLRFMYLFLNGEPAGHVQSIILAAILIISGVMCCLMGLLADLVTTNRKLNEDVLGHLRRLDLTSSNSLSFSTGASSDKMWIESAPIAGS